MKLPDAIQAAAEKKIVAELKPISDKLTRLRATLDAYEIRVREDVERRVSNAILAALDMEQTVGDNSFEGATEDLRTAIQAVAELVGFPFVPSELGVKEVPAAELVVHAPEPVNLPAPPAPVAYPTPTEPSPPPSEELTADQILAKAGMNLSPPAPVSTPAPLTRPPRKATPEDIAAAKRLITEVETLKLEIKQHHPRRLFPLLQAITAEIKLLLERLPFDNFLYERLGPLLSVVGQLKVEGNVPEFIRGLKFGSHGDWERLSYKNRQIVEKYDRDAEQPAPQSKDYKPKPQKGHAEPDTNGKGHQWPAYPRLRAVTKPVLLAGGIKIPEKIKSVHERFGIELEWHEIDHDNPRASQTLMRRIRSGKVGAVILLEGVMRHSTYKPVVEACNNMGVPYAMGDKAGIASLSDAFAELERMLSLPTS